MMGMSTLGVGISWPRNRAEAQFQAGKYFQAAACFTQKRQLFLHLPPQSCKTHLKLLCPRIFETVQMVLSKIWLPRPDSFMLSAGAKAAHLKKHCTKPLRQHCHLLIHEQGDGNAIYIPFLCDFHFQRSPEELCRGMLKNAGGDTFFLLGNTLPR